MIDTASKQEIERMVRTWAIKWPMGTQGPLSIDAKSELDLIIDMICLTSEYARNFPKRERS